MKMEQRRPLQKIAYQIIILAAACCVTATGMCIAAQEPKESRPQMTDQAISDKIEDELAIDPGVTSTKLDVSTANGIVTLSGEVNNLLAQERATRIAETVRGVRAVVNRVSVRPVPPVVDSRIKQDIDAALLEDPATDSYEVSAEISNGQVTLSGTVDSYQERGLVETVAKGVRGVRGLKNEINVEQQDDRSDREIRNDIEQALRWNVNVDNYLIKAEVSDGKATLTGTVGSAAEKRIAENEAWVAGVKSVDSSSLKVEKWARDKKLRGDKYIVKSEEEIFDAVNDALLYDPRVRSFKVDVDVTGNMVTLRGKVTNLKAKRAAGQDARHTVGVTYVDNRLKVRVDTVFRDGEIAARIRDALQRDPYVDQFEITATVLNGTAHLYGAVDTPFEKNWADDVASRVAGVLDVVNHLDVENDTAYIYNPYLDHGYIDRGDMIDFEPRAPLMSDGEIKAEIEDELWWSPFVSSDTVDVTVDHGVAILTGTVDTWNEFRAATDNAYEGGATLVENDLVVTLDE